MSSIYNAGARWVRINAPDTSRNDPIVQSARAAGLKVDLVLEDWVSGDASGNIGALAHNLAAQYGPQGIHTYEILNEPNKYLAAPTYTPLLQAAYTRIHATDGAATVISGGMEPAGGAGEPYNYLSAMYNSGAGGYMDAVGMHPGVYSGGHVPNDNLPAWNPWQYMPMGWPTSSCANVGPSDCLTSIMAAHGDGAKKIWITEFGSPTGTDGGYPAYSQQVQATSITQAFADANSVSYAGPVFNYQWQDDQEGDFGLLTSGGGAKSALAAFSQAVRSTTPSPSSLSAGQALQPNERIMSNSGTALLMQTDGNLVLYGASGRALWASNTFGHGGAYALMQGDGNLVVHNPNATPIWGSNSYGNPSASLVVQDDGNLVIYASNGRPVWSTGTYGS